MPISFSPPPPPRLWPQAHAQRRVLPHISIPVNYYFDRFRQDDSKPFLRRRPEPRAVDARRECLSPLFELRQHACPMYTPLERRLSDTTATALPIFLILAASGAAAIPMMADWLPRTATNMLLIFITALPLLPLIMATAPAAAPLSYRSHHYLS